MKRCCGVLMPVFSLPSPYGIGTFGREAYKFADFLKASGFGAWQMLPLGPTSYGDSPYQSFSSCAGNPYFIDLDTLIDDGLLEKSEVERIDWGSDKTRVDYEKIYLNRMNVLALAKARGYERDKTEIEEFIDKNKAWVYEYALFMALKKHFGMKPWTQWPDEGIRRHEAAATEKYHGELKDDIELYIYVQYLFFKQWNALKSYINNLGITIIGDVPIYVAMDSVEVWSRRDMFALDENLSPKEVAGVPPDYFSEDGQLWGNPLYNWQRMEETGFDWWINRLNAAAKLFDIIRIDHFRGIESYYAVPFGESTARNGRWVKGPGMAFVNAVKKNVKAEFIAEDLGCITDEVRALLKSSGFPGMRVLQFAFDGLTPSDYQPHAYIENCVCYTGTHDNSPTPLWVKEADEKVLEYAKKYLGVNDNSSITAAMLRAGMASVARLFVAELQDYLNIADGGRINTPGTSEGNWRWRLDGDTDIMSLSKSLYEQAKLYARI